MKGTITSLQRMSVHDGPGIRTVVFMKGCNMRCRWCHNPETWSPKRQLQYVGSKCIKCLTCVHICPCGAVKNEENSPMIDFETCCSCGVCSDNCCTGALSMVGRDIDAVSLWGEIEKDLPYFRNSSGGVTLSGGEPLLQKSFVKEFLSLCRARGVNTAIETNMSVDWSVIEDIAPLADTWMCDFKILDPEKHRLWTGLDNRRILGNIVRLAKTGREIVVRTPVIPGVNDTEAEIGGICGLLSPFSTSVRYELLGFHTLGFGKYDSLGMCNVMKHESGLPQGRLDELKQILIKYNF